MRFRKLYPWLLSVTILFSSYHAFIAWYFGENLNFQPAGSTELGDDLYEAKFIRNNRTYILIKSKGQTNWNLTGYKLYVITNQNEKIELGGYTTCGRYKLEAHQISFYTLFSMCGLITRPANNIFPDKLETIKFDPPNPP